MSFYTKFASRLPLFSSKLTNLLFSVTSCAFESIIILSQYPSYSAGNRGLVAVQTSELLAVLLAGFHLLFGWELAWQRHIIRHKPHAAADAALLCHKHSGRTAYIPRSKPAPTDFDLQL